MQISKEQKTSFNWLSRIDPNNLESMKKETQHCLKSLLFSNDQGLNLIFILCNFCHCPSIQSISEPENAFSSVLVISKDVYHRDQTIPTNVNILFNPLWKRIKLVEDLLFQFNFLCLLNWNMSVWLRTSSIFSGVPSCSKSISLFIFHRTHVRS